MAGTDKDGNRPVVLVASAVVRDIAFSHHRFLCNPLAQGYVETEVDDFLDEITATLEYYEHLVDKIYHDR